MRAPPLQFVGSKQCGCLPLSWRAVCGLSQSRASEEASLESEPLVSEDQAEASADIVAARSPALAHGAIVCTRTGRLPLPGKRLIAAMRDASVRAVPVSSSGSHDQGSEGRGRRGDAQTGRRGRRRELHRLGECARTARRVRQYGWTVGGKGWRYGEGWSE